jgi:hypothetical protein
VNRVKTFLGRWQILGAQDIGEDPYLDRLRILVTPLFAVYLHHIRRADETPPHDHPWWFGSLVLTGAYEEVVTGPGYSFTRVNKRGSFHAMRLTQRHIITRVTKPLWTLVFTGVPRNLEWGFYPDGKHVPWYEYEAREQIVAGWPSWKQHGVLK